MVCLSQTTDQSLGFSPWVLKLQLLRRARVKTSLFGLEHCLLGQPSWRFFSRWESELDTMNEKVQRYCQPYLYIYTHV